MKIMHTMASDACPKVPKRRYYSPELKIQIVAECALPEASVASVALSYGINANMVHHWLREHTQGTLAKATPAFIPVTLHDVPRPAPAPAPPADIRIEVHRASTTIAVNWPLQGGATCAQWLREWLA